MEILLTGADVMYQKEEVAIKQHKIQSNAEEEVRGQRIKISLAVLLSRSVLEISKKKKDQSIIQIRSSLIFRT